MILRIDYYLMIILCLGIMERTNGCIMDVLEVWRTSKGAQVKEEAQTESNSSLFWSPGPARSKTKAQDASGLHLRRSAYG
jgi:hypothetical protein